MSISPARKLIPIYTSRGEAAAFLAYPYIYGRNGDWIGWVTADQKVYSVHGHYVGIITKEPRILRKRESDYLEERVLPPSPPPPIRAPSQVPLAPLMKELSVSTIDVLDDAPDLMPPVDFGELRDDMD
jgi:hypothetical protein